MRLGVGLEELLPLLPARIHLGLKLAHLRREGGSVGCAS